MIFNYLKQITINVVMFDGRFKMSALKLYHSCLRVLNCVYPQKEKNCARLSLYLLQLII